jgi:hypothetical protein
MAITYDQAGVTYDSTLYTYNGEPFSPSVFPVAGVYIAFTDGPYVASPAWTEVTTYVRGLSIHRGRSSEFDQFDTGTAQLVLDNRDRRFDPFYTSGPYYTKLTPRRQIRVVGQIGGSTYEVFRGYIAGWPVEWTDAGYDSTVTIQAFDALGLMANEVVPTDWLTEYLSNITSYLYFTGAGSRGLSYLVSYDGQWGFFNNAPGALPDFYETPALLDGIQTTAKYCALYATNRPKVTTAQTSFSLTGYVQFQGPSQFISDNGSVGAYYGNTVLLLTFQYETSGGFTKNVLYVRVVHDAAGTGKYYSANVSTSTAQGFFFTMNYNGSTDTPTLYVNGVAVALTYVGVDPSSGGSSIDYLSAGNCAVAQLAFIIRELTSTEITTAASFAQARLQETTTARMQRLINETDYPAALQSFTASPVAAVSALGTGAGVVPEMQLVADSEGGELYVSKTGVLTTTSRFDVFNATRSANSQATFTDSGVGLRYGPGLLIEYDADNLKNDITINLGDDSEVNVFSQAVIDTYGAASTTIETLLNDVISARQLATLELGVEGSLVPRISPIDVSVNTAAADWQTILGLELLDRVTFKRTPTVGNQFDRAALINAIDHQIEPGVWRTQLTLSMRYTSPLTLDDDVLGTLDFNYLG